MAEAVIVAPDFLLPDADCEGPLSGAGILVENGAIVEVGPLSALIAQRPAVHVEFLPDCLVMPGLVNAHQHGRGLSQVQLGFPDDFLEVWIGNRRRRGVLDAYPITRLAAANMVANGVTSTVHANYSYGSGDYESEVRASLRAYAEVGLRVTMCVGAMDRGFDVYPPHEACFLVGLPGDLREWLARPRRAPYAADGPQTIALMERLRDGYRGHPLIRFCYGPAGPQWVSDDLWRLIATDAEGKSLGIHLHALESPAQAAAAHELYPEGTFRHLRALGVLGQRTVVAHGVWATEDDIDLMAASGTMVVRNPGGNLRLRNGIAPVMRYLAKGVAVAVGTDNVSLSDDEDVVSEARLACLLAREPSWTGTRLLDWRDMVRMLTENGARAAQRWPEIGRIAPGARADLVAFSLVGIRRPYVDADTSIMELWAARITGRDVRLTMVDGRILYRDGSWLTVSRDEVEAGAVGAAMAARLPADPASVAFATRFGIEVAKHYRRLAQGNPS